MDSTTRQQLATLRVTRCAAMCQWMATQMHLSFCHFVSFIVVCCLSYSHCIWSLVLHQSFGFLILLLLQFASLTTRGRPELAVHAADVPPSTSERDRLQERLRELALKYSGMKQ